MTVGRPLAAEKLIFSLTVTFVLVTLRLVLGQSK